MPTVAKWPSNTKVAMPTCYCKQKLAMLAQASGSSDWSTVLELILMSDAVCKGLNYFNEDAVRKRKRDGHVRIAHTTVVCF